MENSLNLTVVNDHVPQVKDGVGSASKDNDDVVSGKTYMNEIRVSGVILRDVGAMAGKRVYCMGY